MRVLIGSLLLLLACRKEAPPAKPPTVASVHDVTVQTIDGAAKPLREYAGKVLLIVNVASQCGFTPQYEGLQKLHETYAARGLRVLGFPANDFGEQEPGSNAEIKSFCSDTYHVGFDLFAKASVVKPGASPLFTRLTDPAATFGGPIGWNFTKFLVDKEGLVAARFEPVTSPLAANVVAAIEQQLAR